MITALIAAVASFAVMVSVMNLSGYIVVGHGPHQGDTFWVISAHIVGMYGLVLVVGNLIDRIGRLVLSSAASAMMGLSTIVMAWITSVGAMSIALFGLGLGWSLSYVAATSELVDRAALSGARKLVGFSDLLSGFTGAALALLGRRRLQRHRSRGDRRRRDDGRRATRLVITLAHRRPPAETGEAAEAVL